MHTIQCNIGGLDTCIYVMKILLVLKQINCIIDQSNYLQISIWTSRAHQALVAPGSPPHPLPTLDH